MSDLNALLREVVREAIRDELRENVDLQRVVALAVQNGPPVPPKWLTTEQAAAYLGCSTQFLEIGRSAGSKTDTPMPKYIKVSKGMVRYATRELDKFMQQRERKNTAGDQTITARRKK